MFILEDEKIMGVTGGDGCLEIGLSGDIEFEGGELTVDAPIEMVGVDNERVDLDIGIDLGGQGMPHWDRALQHFGDNDC